MPIYLRITVNGKRAELSASRECDPALWNTKKGNITGNKEEAKILNSYLDKMKAGNIQFHLYQLKISIFHRLPDLRKQYILVFPFLF